MIREVCVCGHDKATHHEGKAACLQFFCECERYRDRDVSCMQCGTRGKHSLAKCAETQRELARRAAEEEP